MVQSQKETNELLFVTEQKSPLGNFLVTILMSAGLLVLGFNLGKKSVPTSIETVPVQKMTVSESPRFLTVKTTSISPVAGYSVPRSYTGEVTPVRESELGFERSGKVVSLLVNEGEQITKGMTIAKLDTSELATEKLNLQAQKAQALAVLAEFKAGPRPEAIAAAQANIEQIQARLTLEKTKQARREYLYREGAIAREQLDEVSFNSNALSAELAEAQSRLNELKAGTRIEQIQAQQGIVKQIEAKIKGIDLKITKSVLKAPYHGTIAQRMIDEGTVISVGQGIFRLAQVQQPEVRIGIPVDQVSQLKQGSRHSVEINEQVYSGIVTAILPEVIPTTRTQTVILTLQSSSTSSIPKGAIARFNLTENIEMAGFWLPTTALMKGQRGLWLCYAVVESDSEVGIVEPRDIEVLYTQSDRVLVRGTLQAGDKIITQGTQRVVPGQKVID